MAWPVAHTLMIEPTECESKKELDYFCQALITIRSEIKDLEQGLSPQDSPLKNAPHVLSEALGEWPYPYSKKTAYLQESGN